MFRSQRQDSSEAIRTIASSLKAKVFDRDQKSPTRLCIPRFQTKNSEISIDYKTVHPYPEVEFRPKSSFTKTCMKKQKENREQVYKSKVMKNLDRIKRINNLAR